MRGLLAACAGLLVSGGAFLAIAQVQYATGQNVAPTFEGWEHNPDGTYSLVFGYLNRNYEEEVDIPIGPANSISMGPEVYGDRGQPTHFYPRRQRFLFKVVVPADWDKKEKVVWTLTLPMGKLDQARQGLAPAGSGNWSEGVIVENMGGEVPRPLTNKTSPSVTIGPAQTITLLGKATVTASATDDGLPKPYRKAPSNPDRDSQPRRPRGVQIKWIQYRGPGKVTSSIPSPARSSTASRSP